jgi:MFS family permease
VGLGVDRVGRKPFMLIGGVLTLLGFASYSLASFWLLLGSGMVFVMLDSAIRATASYAALGDAAKAGRVGRVFSLDLGVTEGAATIAPLLGGYVATVMAIPLRMMFAMSGLVVILAMIVVLVGYKPPTAQTRSRQRVGWRSVLDIDRRLLPLVAVVAFDAAAWRISFPFWTLYIFKEMHATQEQLGIALAISAGIPALTGFTLGSKLDKVGRTPFLALSEWSAIGAFLPLLLGTRPEFAYVSAIFWGLVYSLWMPAINAYIVDHFGSERFGQTLGTMSLVAGIISAASPALGGWLWDTVSPKAPFILTLVTVTALGFFIWFRLEETTPTRRPQAH